MVVQAITDASQFESAISDIAIVDFTASWCGPCRMISPVFEQFSEGTDIKFYKVDIDDVSDVAASQEIRSVPMFRLYKEGKIMDEVAGADPAKLELMIQKAAKL